MNLATGLNSSFFFNKQSKTNPFSKIASTKVRKFLSRRSRGLLFFGIKKIKLFLLFMSSDIIFKNLLNITSSISTLNLDSLKCPLYTFFFVEKTSSFLNFETISSTQKNSFFDNLFLSLTLFKKTLI